ncbi:hypothetical protein [Lysobacter terrae]
MKTKNPSLLGRTLALTLAIALTGPAFAREHGPDWQQENKEHKEKDAQRAPKKAQESDYRAPSGRQNETFAPSRPDPRAMQMRQREAEDRNDRADAMRERMHQQQRESDQRAAQVDQAQRRQAKQRREFDRRQAEQRDRERIATTEQARRDADRDRIAQTQRHAQERRENLQGDRREDQQQWRQADARRDAVRREAVLRDARREDARRNDARREARVSDQERQRRIDLQQQRLAQYRRETAAREALERQRIISLQEGRRLQQFRYQQDYWRRQRELRNRWDARSYSYYNDPFYYQPISYRYLRAGRWYDVNRYAANLLQQAIRTGYDQGYRAGEADRLDGWHYDYRGNYAYLDANYGYYGYYVDQSEYNYYFRQAFQRGYQDGYGRAYRYGRYDDGSYVILASVLQTILNLRPY